MGLWWEQTLLSRNLNNCISLRYNVHLLPSYSCSQWYCKTTSCFLPVCVIDDRKTCLLWAQQSVEHVGFDVYCICDALCTITYLHQININIYWFCEYIHWLLTKKHSIFISRWIINILHEPFKCSQLLTVQCICFSVHRHSGLEFKRKIIPSGME